MDVKVFFFQGSVKLNLIFKKNHLNFRDEIKSLTDKESSPFLHYVLNKYDEWKKLEKRGGYYENNFYFFH